MTRRRLLTGGGLVLTIFGLHGLAQGQRQQPPSPPPINQSDDPMLRAFRFRSIGPANIGGRIDDIAVVESNPSIVYIGFATGGVWKTVNNGTTWTPIFDTYPVASIGDIAISPSNPDVIYVGTGEANNRQSSSFGAGVYKSTDAGKTFTLTGLQQTQTIARIVIDPKDPNVVYVAALGHLFGPNADRGIYKTTDGGTTWNKVKFVDEDTGFTDLVIDPSDSKTLYAASYQRRRVPWGFNGGGPGSGLWKTTDAGRTWTKLTGNGLPGSPIIGRIGLDIARSKPTTIYAQIEVGASGGTGAGVTDAGLEAPPTQGPFAALLAEGATPEAGQQPGRPTTPGASAAAQGTPATGRRGGQPRPGTPPRDEPPAGGRQPGAAQQAQPPKPPDPNKSGGVAIRR